jgi:hypothetical protein
LAKTLADRAEKRGYMGIRNVKKPKKAGLLSNLSVDKV